MTRRNLLCRTILTLTAILFVGPKPSALQSASEAKPNIDLCTSAVKLPDPDLRKICKEIRHLGFGTFSELGLIPRELDILKAINTKKQGREELSARRQFFAYDVFIITVMTESDRHLDMVLRAASALDTLKRSHNEAYEFIVSTMSFPTAPSMPDTQWKNKATKIFISFDKTPDYIGAGATLVGSATTDKGLSLFSNYTVISVDEETILGAFENMGSRRIYKQQSAEENYKRYMADGLIFTLVHEMTHRYIDHRNSTSRLANTIYQSRNKGGDDAEEIVANETALALLRGRLSIEQMQELMNENTDLIRKSGVSEQLTKLGAIRVESRNLLVVPD